MAMKNTVSISEVSGAGPLVGPARRQDYQAYYKLPCVTIWPPALVHWSGCRSHVPFSVVLGSWPRSWAWCRGPVLPSVEDIPHRIRLMVQIGPARPLPLFGRAALGRALDGPHTVIT